MPSRLRNRQLSGQRDRFRAILQFELFRRYEGGAISEYNLEKSLAASNSDRFINKIMRRYDRTGPTDVLGADWDSIIAWFQENWPQLLQMMMSLVMIFMDSEDDRDRS